ncbi:contractile injection system protein, VgrG/Pvc8 family, partial [Paraburkholderia aspalathi]|uniref:contractile injection system protein, VgrG/Pvc8 family n=1 Tax=Paraburkholderia aspalathi TaxID=1324617 RepID=UPI001BA45CD5
MKNSVIEVFGAERISDISVVSYRAVEKMGQSYRVDIVAACPQKLTRDVILGHEAKFRLVPDDGGEPVVYWGRITGFAHTKTTKDLSSYELVLKAHIGCLNPHTTQTYQNSSAPEIIDAVLRRNELKGHQFIFKLRRQYPRHPFTEFFKLVVASTLGFSGGFSLLVAWLRDDTMVVGAIRI